VVFLVPLVLAVAGSLMTTKSFSVRYALPALLGFVPLTAIVLTRLPFPAWRVGTGALVALWLWADVQWFTTPAYWKEDSRAVAACLNQVLPPGATILVAPPYMAPVLGHYVTRDRGRLRLRGAGGSDGSAPVRNAAGLVLTRPQHVHNPAGLRQTFTGRDSGSRGWTGAIGYEVHFADSAAARRAEACQGSA
jgi:hypothetical protein